MMLLFITTILPVLSILPSDTTPQPAEGSSSIMIVFDNKAGTADLQLNTGKYISAAGEPFTVSLLQYYVSNITFTKTDGTLYTVPQLESYFLIKEQDAASQKIMLQIPEGTYKSMSFIVGIDSTRSTKPISERPGVLDPANTPPGQSGMYWSWNSGYIFYKFEGQSDSAKVDPSGNRKFRYHIGLFGGMNSPTVNNIKTQTIDLSAKGNVVVKKGRAPAVVIEHDILKTLNGDMNLRFATNSTIMVSPFSVNVANNYAHGFSHVATIQQ